MTLQIRNVGIIGERHSSTNLLECLVKSNLNMEVGPGPWTFWKHGFQTATNPECAWGRFGSVDPTGQKSLYLVIVRNP